MLNSIRANCLLEKNSFEKDVNRDASICLQVARRFPYSGVVRCEVISRSTSRGMFNRGAITEVRHERAIFEND